MNAKTPEDALLSALESALEAEAVETAHRREWLATARPEQLPPAGNWRVWLILAGRGFGKTRAGAEMVADYALRHPGSRIAVVAPTAADARDTCVEGESGLRSIIPRDLVETWNRSLGELILKNSSRFKLFSAEEPERLRGPQHHYAWCDELAAWKQPETWDQLQFGLRLGDDPRIVATTTPKPTRLIRDLVSRPTTAVTTGSTFDNAAHLPAATLDHLRTKYEGTRLGRQELFAEILTDIPGALWTRAMLDEARTDTLPTLQRIVIGVDPSGSSGESGDAQGIVVCGVDSSGRGYVLEDATMRGSPAEWAERVAKLFEKHMADRVIAEKNFGGAMVDAVLRGAFPNLPITLVTASKGKAVRAEPIAALYEQKRVSHFGDVSALEDEMVQMAGHGFTGAGSPNRLDALVWALTDLMLNRINSGGLLELITRELAETNHERPQPILRTYAKGSLEHERELAQGGSHGG